MKTVDELYEIVKKTLQSGVCSVEDNPGTKETPGRHLRIRLNIGDFSDMVAELRKLGLSLKTESIDGLPYIALTITKAMEDNDAKKFQINLAGVLTKIKISQLSTGMILRKLNSDEMREELGLLLYTALQGNIDDTKSLLNHPYLNLIEPEEIANVLFKNRASLVIGDVKKCLESKGLSLQRLVLHDPFIAIDFLKSSYFREHFSALELAEIYYHHRHDSNFTKTIVSPQQDGRPMFSIAEILNKAQRENQLKSVRNIISQSATLLNLALNEIKKARGEEPSAKPKPEARAPKPVAAIDPYAILEVDRDADMKVIRKAYLAKAKELHPDHFKTEKGVRFMQVKDAFDILQDPIKRAEWNAANPQKQEPVLPGAQGPS